MTVRFGREFLSIPGPTNVPDAVLSAMHRPAVDIYEGELVEITSTCLDDLRRLFQTEGRTYIYASNGHGVWEAALTNVLSRGEKILALSSGRFARGWGEMAAVLGLDVEVVESPADRGVDPAVLEDRLRKDVNGEIKAVLIVQIDTASGVVNDIAKIRAAMDAAGCDALLLVDGIASIGTMAFEMDAWRVDVAVTGSQKGLMLPPGLGFVAAGKRALEARKSADLVTRYWDWSEREGAEHYQKYCGTPPVHLLFGLRKSLDMLQQEGFEQVFERHRILAGAVHSAVDKWAEGQVLGFNISEPGERAVSVTTINMAPPHDPQRFRAYCKDACGVVLGTGIGDFGDQQFRIAHMGFVNAPMVLGTLAVAETGLQALDIPHGRGGVQAAVDFISRNVPAET